MNFLKQTLPRLLCGLLFAGFVLPLWMAYSASIYAMHQIADAEEVVSSMPWPSVSRDLASIGYAWCGCSMIWLFWYVTRKPRTTAEQVSGGNGG